MLKDPSGEIVKEMVDDELDNYLRYVHSERPEGDDYHTVIRPNKLTVTIIAWKSNFYRDTNPDYTSIATLYSLDNVPRHPSY